LQPSLAFVQVLGDIGNTQQPRNTLDVINHRRIPFSTVRPSFRRSRGPPAKVTEHNRHHAEAERVNHNFALVERGAPPPSGGLRMEAAAERRALDAMASRPPVSRIRGPPA
jgi:hypothetical protein